MRDPAGRGHDNPAPKSNLRVIEQACIEIVSDSGEGAQKAGQSFGAVCAKMGNGVWTVEIIPAEIKPPARSPAGASGIRIRFGTEPVTNSGDEADLVIALNEQVLYGRIAQKAYRPGTVILLENKWADDPDERIRQKYADGIQEFRDHGFEIIELPLELACKKITPKPALGKNMFVLGMLCAIYQRDLEKATQEIELIFIKKSEQVRDINRKLLLAGYAFAEQEVDFCFEVPSVPSSYPQLVMNGNQGIGLGVMASGMELVSMYPITPATSASHYLADVFQRVGGFVHQAEDEIAAIGFAIGASYAGRTACTITSGPGMALKTEMLGLASMAEIPLVIVNVQRGGPSTGLPTKVEQSDLLSTIYGTPGDAPKVVIALSTIDECISMVVVARKIAESFRMPVILLSDANLATGVTSIRRPEPQLEWLAPPVDQSPWNPEVPAYDWDPETGLSKRPIPGQVGGEYVLTGLAHSDHSKVAYDSATNMVSAEMRSRKLATLQATLEPPKINGETSGNLLVVGWGSTLGAIEEAVAQARADGQQVSSLHLRFISPMEPGLFEIFSRFDQILTIEINYSDDIGTPQITAESARPAQLALLLRAHTQSTIEYWSQVPGEPLRPRAIRAEISRRLEGRESGADLTTAMEGR